MNFTHEFIEDILTEMPERLQQQYDALYERFNRKKRLIFQEKTIDILNKRLDSFFYSADEYLELLNKCKHNKLTKKIRWLSDLEKKINTLSTSDPQHPFYDIYLLKKNSYSWSRIYGNQTVNDVISLLVEDCKKWRMNPDALYIDYPLFHTVTYRSASMSIDEDIYHQILLIYRNKYQFKPQNFYTQYPTDLINKPLWRDKNTKEVKNKTPGPMQEEIIFDNDGQLRMMVEYSNVNGQLTTYRPLDEKDNEIFQMTLSAALSKRMFASEPVVSLKLRDIAKEILSGKSNYSTNALNSLAKRILNMQRVQYLYTTSGDYRKNSISFSLFDNILIKDDICIFTFSKMTSTAIINNQLLNVKTRDLNCLDSQPAKLMCFALHNERIKLHQMNQGMTNNYGYEFFLMNIRFSTKSKKKNLDTIEKALQEYCNKQILIKEYIRTGDVFTITMFPLSPLEEADLDKRNPSQNILP